MNKTEFMKSIVEKSGQDKKAVDAVLTALDEIIKSSMTQGDSIPLASIGTFKVSDRAARTGRNPITGETIQVPAKRVPKFAFSKSVKETVSGKSK